MSRDRDPTQTPGQEERLSEPEGLEAEPTPSELEEAGALAKALEEGSVPREEGSELKALRMVGLLRIGQRLELSPEQRLSVERRVFESGPGADQAEENRLPSEQKPSFFGRLLWLVPVPALAALFFFLRPNLPEQSASPTALSPAVEASPPSAPAPKLGASEPEADPVSEALGVSPAEGAAAPSDVARGRKEAQTARAMRPLAGETSPSMGLSRHTDPASAAAKRSSLREFELESERRAPVKVAAKAVASKPDDMGSSTRDDTVTFERALAGFRKSLDSIPADCQRAVLYREEVCRAARGLCRSSGARDQSTEKTCVSAERRCGLVRSESRARCPEK